MLAVREGIHPSAGHILEPHPCLVPSFRRSQVDDVIAVHVIGAKNTGIDATGQTLIGLLHRRDDLKREVESRDALRIEAGASNGRAISGGRFEGPAWVVRTVAYADKSQAKPPTARWSR